MSRTFAILLLLCVPASAETEREACDRLAEKYAAETEVVLPDESRVDLLSETTAWEADWAEKWPEAVGQSVLYAIWTDREPGIILLVRDRRAEKHYLLRCRLVCERLGITMRAETIK